MKEIDCLGEICPVPIIALKKELPALRQGETVLLVTDHSCTRGAVYDFCKNCGLEAEDVEVMNGVWEITVRNASRK